MNRQRHAKPFLGPFDCRLPENWLELRDRMLLGLDDMQDIRLVPQPEQVWQLEGHVPDVAVLARDEADARERIRSLYGLEGKLVRLR